MSQWFASPAFLLLLPLALLPLWRLRSDQLDFPSLAWLPRSRKGEWLDRGGRLLAALVVVAIVIGLAGPRQGPTTVERWTRGAEIVIAFDRSSSMDEHLRNINMGGRHELVDRVTKNEAVRNALLAFVSRRPDDRYALTMFGTATLRILPLTDDVAAIRAGLEAAAIGRGLPRTDMAAVLRSSIAEFDDRPYAGSRAILLVSDGGARLEADVRQEVAEGLRRNRIALYFLHIRSSSHSPDLLTIGDSGHDNVEEVALHRFFRSVGTPYFVFQATDPASIDAAIAAFDKQQNLPLLVEERVPRLDYQRAVLIAAILLCAALLAFRTLKLEALR